jgi:fructose-specific phosphotransferase system IIC component
MNISKLLLLLITLIIGILVGMIILGMWRKHKEEEKIEVK